VRKSPLIGASAEQDSFVRRADKLNDRRSILSLFLNASQLAQKRVQSR
jgi:hypothetical protein